MKYVMMVYERPEEFMARTGEEKEEYWGAWKAYSRALGEAGVLAGGHGLLPPETGTTLRIANGTRHVQDGPYAETKEQLGGFFVLQVPDLDAALDWAAKCPAAGTGALEIRPVLEMQAGAAN